MPLVLRHQWKAQLLKTELVDLEEDEEAEIEVINYLVTIGHGYRVNVITILAQTLYYAERNMNMYIRLSSRFIPLLRKNFT